MERPRILVVDDHEDSASLTIKILQSHGFEADSAGCAQEARVALEKRDYQLFLLDVGLPDCHGASLCREIKSNYPDVPVIFCSAIAGRQAIYDCLSCCGEAYFCKPLDWPNLLAAIRYHVCEKWRG